MQEGICKKLSSFHKNKHSILHFSEKMVLSLMVLAKRWKMYNLYQSQLWQDIQTKIYKKPHHTVTLFGKEYFCLEKTKKVGPFLLKRFQVMWVELPENKKVVEEELTRIQRKYGKDRKNISFQLWINNEIISFENVSHRSKDFKQDMRQMRLNIRKYLTQTYDLKLTIRENMPQCDIVYNITKTDEELLSEMNSGAKERIKKGMKKGVVFERVEPEKYEQFYQHRLEIAGEKGFNIMPYRRFTSLVAYIRDKKAGDLFLSRVEDKILAGSLCLFDEGRVIYYQGFANRDKKLRNIWGHAYLKFEIMRRARGKGFHTVDMMWGAPTGFPEHPLAGVTKFKESLWGMKIEQYGSYDIVLNKRLYKIFEWYTKSRH